MKPKAALVKSGDLPAGSENKRGRLSGALIERVKELAAQNPSWNIEGYTVSTPKDSTAPVTVEKTAVVSGGIADVREPFRDEREWEAYANVNGTVRSIGMRTVCNTCHNSLSYCPCRTPYVWVDHENQAVVNFKGRTTPYTNKRY